MRVSVVVEFVEKNFQFSGRSKPWINFDRSWAEPPPVSLVPTKFPAFDFREAGCHG